MKEKIKTEQDQVFKNFPVPKALRVMIVPAVISQLIVLNSIGMYGIVRGDGGYPVLQEICVPDVGGTGGDGQISLCLRKAYEGKIDFPISGLPRLYLLLSWDF